MIAIGLSSLNSIFHLTPINPLFHQIEGWRWGLCLRFMDGPAAARIQRHQHNLLPDQRKVGSTSQVEENESAVQSFVSPLVDYFMPWIKRWRREEKEIHIGDKKEKWKAANPYLGLNRKLFGKFLLWALEGRKFYGSLYYTVRVLYSYTPLKRIFWFYM